MDTNDKIVGVIFNIDKAIYERLISQGLNSKKAALVAAQTAMIFKQDPSKHEIVDFGSYADNAKETKINQIYMRLERDGGEKSSYFSGDPNIIDALDRAANHKEYLSIEKRETTTKEAVNKATNNRTKKVAAGVLTGIVVASLAACSMSKNKEEEYEPVEVTLTEDPEEVQGYGFYKFDLSNMEDMSEYRDNTSILTEAEIEAQYGIKGVSQKDRSLLRLNILEEFNNEIDLVDGETQQLSGLTIEQLIALDAYANSNIYEAEDYIKNFGLYNFKNITDDFQQATLVASAYLADPSVDGSALADIFLDEAVKENYLKQLDYRDKILNAETKKEKDKFVKEYVEFLSDCSINQASDEYLDYDQHPGMAFVTSAVVNSLNYHNIALDKDIVSKVIIIGTDENQSKLNSICADAQAKLDAAVQLVDSLEIYLPMNYNIKIDNEKEIELAEQEGREPKLKELYFAELDTVVRELICDQYQINELTNKTLEKEDKLVTTEDQKVTLTNVVKIQRALLDAGQGYYRDEHTARLASQLLKPGDTVRETQQDVTFKTPEEVQKLEENAPEQVQEAKDNFNQENGTIANSTPEEKQQVQEQIQEDQQQTAQEGKNYYNTVISYYQTHGDISEIPAELQDAYNNLGADTFDMAKETGVAKYMTSDEHKYSGGETIINPGFEDAEIYNTPQAPVESVDNTTKVSEVQEPVVVPPAPDNNTSIQPDQNPVVAPSTSDNSIIVEPDTTIQNIENQYTLEDIENIVSDMTDEEWAVFESTGVLPTSEDISQDEVKTR